MSNRRVIVSVHQRTDTEGFVVRLVVEDVTGERIARFPTDTFEEAEALAISIRGLAETGDVDVLLPDEEDTRGDPPSRPTP